MARDSHSRDSSCSSPLRGCGPAPTFYPVGACRHFHPEPDRLVTHAPEMFHSPIHSPTHDSGTLVSMAAVPNPPLVAVDEYLNSSYRPDMEYVDGVLVERGMPTIAHSLLQMILIQHFGRHHWALAFLPLP